MIDKITPSEDGEGKRPTSRITSRPEGTFGPAETGKVKNPGSEISGSSRSNNPSERINQPDSDQLEQRGRLLGNIDAMFSRSTKLKKKATGEALEKLTKLEEDLETFKAQVSTDGLVIAEAENILRMAESEFDSIEETIQKKEQERLEDFTSLVAAGRDYERLISYHSDTIKKIEEASSSELPEKDAILSEIVDLAWLKDASSINHKLDEGAIDTVGIQERVNKLFVTINEADDTLVNLKENSAEEELKREGGEVKTAFYDLEEEAKSLRVVDSFLRSKNESLSIKVHNSIRSFNKKPNKKTIANLKKVTEEYKESVEKMKASVVKTIEPPAFLSATITPKIDETKKSDTTPLEIPKDEGTREIPNNETPTSSSQATPDATPITSAPVPDVQVPAPKVPDTNPQDDTTIEGLTGSWHTGGYEVLVGSEKIKILNYKIPGTLLRYQDVVNKTKDKGIDFSKADSLKEAVLGELRRADFVQARIEAMALGKELDVIIKEKLTIPDAIVKTRKRFVRAINNKKNSSKDFSQATTLNEELYQALQVADFVKAEEISAALTKELDTLETDNKTDPGSTPDPATQQDPSSQGGTSVPDAVRAVDSIDIPRIFENKKATSDEQKWQIQVRNGKVEAVPAVFLRTLNRYKQLFNNQELVDKGIDFSVATELKDEVIDSISNVKFRLADRKVEALIIELDSIEREGRKPAGQPNSVDPQDTTTADTSSIPQQNSNTQPAAISPDSTKIPGEVRNTPEGLEIRVDGEFKLIPRKATSLLHQFKKAYNNPQNKDKDFSVALTYKLAIQRHIEEGNFDEAIKNAEALSLELNKINSSPKSKSGATTDTSAPSQSGPKVPTAASNKAVNETPQETLARLAVEAEQRDKVRLSRYYQNIHPLTVSRDKDMNWRIKKGEGYPIMGKEELAKWLPIHEILLEYKKFMDSPSSAHDFSFLVNLKNEVLSAVENGDFKLADEKAKEVLRELDPMEGMDPGVADYKTAARLKYETRKRNLDKLNNYNSYSLSEEEAAFAFIDTIGPPHARSLKIIDRNTGDWVPLERKDLDAVLLAQSVLTNFRTRAATPEGCIEKKNQVLSLINAYNFEEGAKAAQEYLDEFAELTRRGTLRPTVSGSTPSPALEKATTSRNFEDQKRLLKETDATLEKITPFLKSDLEKTAFNRLSTELKKLEGEIEANPTKDSLAIFKAKIERYAFELSKKVAFVTAQYGESVLSSSAPVLSTIPAGAKVMLNKRLRGDVPLADATETIEQWTARQATKGSTRDIEETRKKLAEQELYEKHKEIFKKNPGLYKEIYSQKNDARDPLVQDISARAARDVVVELTNKRHEVMSKKIKIQEDIENKVFTGNFEQEMRQVTNEIAALDAEIKKYTQINLTKATAPANSSFITSKQVYSPARDASLNDKTRGIGRNDTLNNNYEPVKIDREALTEKEIEEIYGRDKNGNLNEKAQLSGSLYPNHTEGMVSSLTKSQADKVLGTYEVPKGAKETAQALEDERAQIEREQQTRLTQQATLENNQERHTTVNGLANKLFKYSSTRSRPWGLLAAGLSTVALTTAGVYAAVSAIKEKNEARTLGDVIKNQPNWRTLVGENVPNQFVTDFSGPKEKKFDDFIKVNAPSFAISDTNPAPKDKIANLKCKDVYDLEGAGAGLTEEQQRECAGIIKNLQEIMKATKASTGTIYANDVRLFGDLTVREFYEQVRVVSATADADKNRLI